MEKVVHWMQSTDRTAFLALNGLCKCPLTDKVMQFITSLGGAVWSAVFALILLLSRDPAIYKLGRGLAASLVISHLIVRLGKKYLPRLRPYMVLENINIGRKIYKDSSFPSGHSTAAFCTATVLASGFPAFAAALFVLAAAVALSRVYFGMHYLSDTIAGAAIGIVVTSVII